MADMIALGAEAALSSAASAFFGEVSKAGVQGISGTRRRRSERLEAYRRLHVAALRARLRIGHLIAVDVAYRQPTNLLGGLLGFPHPGNVLERVIEDLTALADAWYTVRPFAPDFVGEAADRLTLAIAEMLDAVEPGWLTSSRRARTQRRLAKAVAQYEQHAAEFWRRSRADAAPSWRDRRAAKCGP